MPRVRGLLFSILLIALAAAIGTAASGEVPHASDTPAQAVGGPVSIIYPDVIPVEDPFPIRRLRVTETQLPDVLKQLDAGPMVRLPRSEFDARVRAAGRAIAETKMLPRIVETRFKASLVGGELVGTAELELANATVSNRFVPLDPLRIAPGPATWADGREAVIGIPPGATTAGVWVDKLDRLTLKFPWSLVGTAEPGERQFDLRVPAAQTATLELELPNGLVPTVPATEVLLTGPFPLNGDPPRSLWRFRFGGRSRLDFSVRPAGNPGLAAAAVLKATYDLVPGQVVCGFEYELRPAKGTVGEWEFAIDPGLRITDVVMNNLANRTITSSAGAGMGRRLRVTLRQPGAGGKINISAVAPLPDTAGTDTPLPMVRPLDGNLDDETIDIRLAPGMKIDYWNPGDYRIIDSQPQTDQSRVVTLIGTLLPPGQERLFRHPPTVRTSLTEADFTTSEQTAWRFDADRATATVRMVVQVRRGSLFQLALKQPKGYTFTRVASNPDELVSYTTSAGGTTTVEFARPLTSGQTAEFTFEFQGPILTSNSQRLAFPAFTPLGAAERVGVLGVIPGALWTTEFQPAVGTVSAGWLDVAVPVSPIGSTSAFRYRAGDPDGWVTLSPAKPEFTVDATVRVTETPEKLVGTNTFTLRVQTGGLTSILVGEPASRFTDRTWRIVGTGNKVVAAISLPSTWFALPFAVLSHGRWSPVGDDATGVLARLWIVRLARPVTSEVTLETTATQAKANSTEGGEAVQHASALLARLSVWGSRQSRVAFAPDSVAVPAKRVAQWAFSGLYLVTAVRAQAEVMVAFGGTVSGGGETALPLTLPAGSEVRAVNVGGRWLEQGAWHSPTTETAGGVLVKLPISPTEPVRFEVRYRLSTATGGMTRLVRSSEPELPGGKKDIRRWWVFAPEVLPGWPVQAWDRESASDFPQLLGDPLNPRGSVFRTSVDEVRVASTQTAAAVGVGFAAVFFLLGWVGGRRRHPLLGLVLASGLLLVGVATLLGPPWWQRAAGVPLVIGLVAAAGMVLARGHLARVPVAVATAILLCVLGNSSTTAQSSTPATVILLPADADGRETAVVPKSVLDRLAIRPSSPGVIVTSAEYTASVDDSTAHVIAKFVVHALDSGDTVATLPLADAKLERVQVNGVQAFPASPKLGVYTVPLSGKTRYEIEVRFAVPVTGSGAERDFRFGVPEGPITRVVADLPGSARQAQVVGRIGKQTLTTGQRVHLESETGAVKTVQVRWRDGAGNAAAVVKVREGCVWDIREFGAELTACYLVRVEQGTISTLRFDVPADLDPLAITVQPLDKDGVAALRDWTLGAEQKGLRQLRLDFQGPTSGRVLVVLALDPRPATTRQPVLRFPKVILPGGVMAEPDASYGLRVRGVVVEELARSGVIDYSPESLTRDFASVPDLHLEANTPPVRVFRPTPGGTPELRPTLRLAIEHPAVTLDTSWHLGIHRADATGTVHWTGRDAVSLIEFVLAAKLTEIRSADVSSWAQSGGRVQVWLKKPLKEGEFSWSAMVPTPAAPFEVATPRALDAKLVMDTVRLRPADGFSLAIERDRGWVRIATPSPSFAYQTATHAVSPVRVVIAALQPNLVPDLGPRPQPKSSTQLPNPTPPLPANPAVGPPAALPAEPRPEPGDRWVWPVSGAVVWCAIVFAWSLLIVRFPRSLWPEQFGLVGALFGAAVVGGWWVGVAAWTCARIVWLLEIVFRPGRPAEPRRA
jgi:hypothetical protein